MVLNQGVVISIGFVAVKLQSRDQGVCSTSGNQALVKSDNQTAFRIYKAFVNRSRVVIAEINKMFWSYVTEDSFIYFLCVLIMMVHLH